MTQAATIIIRKKRRAHDSQHHGGSWKIAYADFVTAMMAFFLLLWLLSTPDKERLEGLADYFSSTPTALEVNSGSDGMMTGQVVRSSGASQNGSSASKANKDSSETQGESAEDKSRNADANRPDTVLRVLADELRLSLEQVSDKIPATKQVSVKEDRKGLRISLVDTESRPMFRSGTADLYPYAVDVLRHIAAKTMKGGYRIAIEGHSDGVGGGSDLNWRLSGDRAQAARKVMLEAGFGSDRIAEVAALGNNEPLFPEDPSRAENRRIVIVVLSEPAAYPQDLTFRH